MKKKQQKKKENENLKYLSHFCNNKAPRARRHRLRQTFSCSLAPRPGGQTGRRNPLFCFTGTAGLPPSCGEVSCEIKKQERGKRSSVFLRYTKTIKKPVCRERRRINDYSPLLPAFFNVSMIPRRASKNAFTMARSSLISICRTSLYYKLRLYIITDNTEIQQKKAIFRKI